MRNPLESPLYRFGAFEASPEMPELRRNGSRIRLQEQPFQLLLMLLEANGEVVTRDDIRRKLWPPDTFVNFEQSVGTAVKKLRQALDDDADSPRYIQTVPKRGYRLLTPVEKIAPVSQPPEVPSVAGVVRKRRLSVRLNWAALAGIFAAAMVALSLVFAFRRHAALAEDAAVEVEPLTRTGDVVTAAISRNGSLLAYVTEADGGQRVLLRHIAGPAATEIISPMRVRYLGLTFSTDGGFLYYVRNSPEHAAEYDLYRIPTFGGAPVQIADRVDSPAGMSPDGKWIAFLRLNPTCLGESIVIARPDGSGEHSLAGRAKSELFGAAPPAWSPDGSRIAVPSSNTSGIGVAIVSVASGDVQRLNYSKWGPVRDMVWLSNSALAVTALDRASRGSQIWEFDVSKGSYRRLTTDAGDYSDLSVGASGKRLLAIERSAPAAIWESSAPDFSNAREIVKDPVDYDFVLALAWANNDRILYSSKAGGSLDLWLLDPENGRAQPILSDGWEHPWIAPAENGTAAFVTFGGPENLVEMLDLATMKRSVLAKGNIGCPDLSPDGKSIIYCDEGRLMHKPADGGPSTILARQTECFPRISPDGKLVAYNFVNKAHDRRGTAIIPIRGGAPIATLELPQDSEWPLKREFQWSPDGSALTYVDTVKGVSNVWELPLRGEPAKQLTHFAAEKIFSFAWSRDGRHLATVRGERANDIVEIHLSE